MRASVLTSRWILKHPMIIVYNSNIHTGVHLCTSLFKFVVICSGFLYVYHRQFWRCRQWLPWVPCHFGVLTPPYLAVTLHCQSDTNIIRELAVCVGVGMPIFWLNFQSCNHHHYHHQYHHNHRHFHYSPLYVVEKMYGTYFYTHQREMLHLQNIFILLQ